MKRSHESYYQGINYSIPHLGYNVKIRLYFELCNLFYFITQGQLSENYCLISHRTFLFFTLKQLNKYYHLINSITTNNKSYHFKNFQNILISFICRSLWGSIGPQTFALLLFVSLCSYVPQQPVGLNYLWNNITGNYQSIRKNVFFAQNLIIMALAYSSGHII